MHFLEIAFRHQPIQRYLRLLYRPMYLLFQQTPSCYPFDTVHRLGIANEVAQDLLHDLIIWLRLFWQGQPRLPR